jgi:hypothetical protein
MLLPHRLLSRALRACVFITLLVPAATFAQIQLTNLTKSTATANGLSDPGQGAYWLAVRFTTGSTATTLNSITAVLQQTAPGTLTADLYAADMSNLPTGASITNFTIGAIGGSLGNVTFTPNSATTLAANTTYVLNLDPVGSGYWTWAGSLNSAGYDSTTGWALVAGNIYSNDFGSTWSNLPIPLTTKIAVDATAVPEPATTAALIGAAALGFIALRRRKA